MQPFTRLLIRMADVCSGKCGWQQCWKRDVDARHLPEKRANHEPTWDEDAGSLSVENFTQIINETFLK